MRGIGREVAAAIDWVALLGGVLAAVPVLVATIHAVHVGWTPSSDDGMIALRAFDVLSSHPPLVGQYSQSSPLIGENTYSLGPMLYWLLAVPAHVGPRAIPLAMGLVNATAVLGSVVLAGRRGGRPLALLTALALVLTVRALPVEAGYEVWNCWAGLFAFTFLLFLAWSVACGDHWLLPLLAVTVSYLLQIHFTYLVPGLAATAVAVVGLVVHRRAKPAGGLRAWVIAAVVLTIACWIPPVIDEATHNPGNLTLAYRLATDNHQTVGFATGWHTLAHSIGIPPWWAISDRNPPTRTIELLGAPTGSAISAGALIAVVVGLLGLALRRRRHDLSTLLALAAALTVSIVIVGASVPVGNVGLAALGYVLVWTVPAGMLVWLAVGWSAWNLLSERRVPLGAPALAAVAAAAVLVAAGRDYEDPLRFPPGLKDYHLITATTTEVTDQLRGSRGVVLDVPIEVRNSLTFQSAIAYAVRRQGLAIAAPPRLSREMGRQYREGPGDFDQLLIVRNASDPAPPGSRVVVRNRAVSVMLKPWTQSPSRSSAH